MAPLTPGERNLMLPELKQAMAAAHPDKGGSSEAFIAARERYEGAKVAAALPDPPTLVQKSVFGVGVTIHPITHRPIEMGSGCKGVHAQAVDHLQHIAAEQGIEAARRVKARLDALTDEHKAAIHQTVIKNRQPMVAASTR